MNGFFIARMLHEQDRDGILVRYRKLVRLFQALDAVDCIIDMSGADFCLRQLSGYLWIFTDQRASMGGLFDRIGITAFGQRQQQKVVMGEGVFRIEARGLPQLRFGCDIVFRDKQIEAEIRLRWGAAIFGSRRMALR